MSENVHECYTVSLSRYPLHLFIYYSAFIQEDLDNKYVIRKKKVKHGNHYFFYMTCLTLQGIFIPNTGTDHQ